MSFADSTRGIEPVPMRLYLTRGPVVEKIEDTRKAHE
jgi:hypothetical protein